MIYIDAIHYSVRDNGVIRKLAAYVIFGLTCDGHKEVLSLSVGDNESSKYWLNVLNELKNRGVKGIMVICADGLTGIKGKKDNLLFTGKLSLKFLTLEKNPSVFYIRNINSSCQLQTSNSH